MAHDLNWSRKGGPMYTVSLTGEQYARYKAGALDSQYVCKSVLMIKGEAFPCDWIETNMSTGTTSHQGWAHGNRAAAAIWGEPLAGVFHQSAQDAARGATEAESETAGEPMDVFQEEALKNTMADAAAADAEIHYGRGYQDGVRQERINAEKVIGGPTEAELTVERPENRLDQVDFTQTFEPGVYTEKGHTPPPKPTVVEFRLKSIRQLVEHYAVEKMRIDDVRIGGLSDRGWLASSVLNILDGTIDDQAPEIEPEGPSGPLLQPGQTRLVCDCIEPGGNYSVGWINPECDLHARNPNRWELLPSNRRRLYLGRPVRDTTSVRDPEMTDEEARAWGSYT